MAGQTAAEFLPQKGAKYEMSQGALITANRPHTHPVTHPTVRNLTQRLLDATLANCDEGISQAMQGLPVCWWRNMHAIFAPDGNAGLAPGLAPLAPPSAPLGGSAVLPGPVRGRKVAADVAVARSPSRIWMPSLQSW